MSKNTGKSLRLLQYGCISKWFVKLAKARKKIEPNYIPLLFNKCGGRGIFDHMGTDVNGDFVCEPYAKSCADCLEQARLIADYLGLRYTLTNETWHARGTPNGLPSCVRITFVKPEVLA
jgi:hypothetical protein